MIHDFAHMKELMPNRVQEYQQALTLLSEKLRVCRYSKATHNTYYGMFRNFLKHTYPIPLHQISHNHVQQYHLHLIRTKNISRSYQNQSINALKFYLEKVLGMDRQIIALERPKKEHKLPEVLSLEEVKVLLGSIPNLKHRTMLTTIYSAGLRMGELLNLKPGDIDSSYMKIWVRKGKGVKDRATLLSPVLLELLRKYYIKYQPKKFLFESPEGEQYNGSSVRKVLKRAVVKAKIHKKVVPHTLRHSFATHLMENGTNLRYIQTLLGHTSSRTTEIYTHVSTKKLDEIASPLDLIS